MKKATADQPCPACVAQPGRPGRFEDGEHDALICRQCKVRLAATEVLADPYADTWADSNQEHLWYLVHTLRHFYWATLRYGGLGKVVGPTLARQFSERWDALLAFARDEDTDYGFSPIEFSLARFERAMKPSDLDFWLTASAAFDMRNYLYDLQEYAREQAAAAVRATTSTKAPPRRSKRAKRRLMPRE